MSDDGTLDRFVKDPSVLVDLCRNVIDLLDAGSEETSVADQEAQFQ